MKRFGIVWEKSIFIKLIIIFLTTMAVVYFLGINTYNNGSKTLKDELSTSALSHVRFFLESFENEIKRIKTHQYNFLNDDNLYKLTSVSEFISDVDRLEAVFRLQQRLISIKESSPYIKRAFVIIPSINMTISNNRSGTTSILIDEFNNLKTVPDLSKAQIIYLENGLYLSVAYPFTNAYNENEDPKYIVGIELSQNAIENSLRQFKSSAESGAILTNHTLEYTFGSQTNKEINRSILEFIKDKSVSSKLGIGRMKISENLYLGIYATSSYLNMTLCKYVKEDDILGPLKKYKFQFNIFLVALLLMVIFNYTSTYKYFYQPLNNLMNCFRRMEQGDLDFSIEHKKDDEFGYLYKRFNEMVENLKRLIEQVYKQKILAQKAELRHLQSQINPHFLYNSFFNLYNMVENEDYENVKYFTRQLGSYFQFITRSGLDEVTLQMEVNHARIYSEIQAKRFRNRIKLRFDQMPERFEGMMVPRLILQPIIENAFEHGLENKLENGEISVTFNTYDNYLRISVEDNGEGLSDEELKILTEQLKAEEVVESTGIINIHRRLRLRYGSGSGVEISKAQAGGLNVIINIGLGEEFANVPTSNCR